MKRITVLTMLCCTLFCVCAIASGIGRERKLLFITSLPVVDHTPPTSTSVAVSGEVITHLDTPTAAVDQDSDGREKSVQGNKVQTVTDITGRKRKLKLGDVDTSNKEILIQNPDSITDYAQVADGHYYYLREEGENRYTLYCDKGDKVGSFKIEKWYYFQGCCKYGDRFYVLLYHEDQYPGVTTDKYSVLTVADFSKRELRMLRKIENMEEYDAYFYKDKIKLYFSLDVGEDYDEDDDGRVSTFQYDMTGKAEPVENFENRNYIMDGNRYYAKVEKKIRIFRENMKNKKVEEIFRYRTKQKVTSRQELEISLDMDEKDMFITEYSLGEDNWLYIVPRSGGKMKLVTNKLCDEEEYTYNSQYIFWLDYYNRIHIWNRKTQKEERMIEPPLSLKDVLAWELNCTEEGFYMQIIAWKGDSGGSEPSYNLYYMGVDGGKYETIWDGKKQKK